MAADDLAHGPVRVMLAKAQDTIAGPAALAGGTVWELKFDGYRAVLRVTDQGAELWSRNGSNLSPVFPDLVAAASVELRVKPGSERFAFGYKINRASPVQFGAPWVTRFAGRARIQRSVTVP